MAKESKNALGFEETKFVSDYEKERYSRLPMQLREHRKEGNACYTWQMMNTKILASTLYTGREQRFRGQVVNRL